MPAKPAFKSTPEIRCIAFPRAAIARRQADEFVIAERLSDILRPGWSDSSGGDGVEGLAELNPTLDWGQEPNFDLIRNIGFARFFPDGTLNFGPSRPDQNSGGEDKSIAVAYILPRQVALDSKIGSNKDDIDGGKTDLNWVADSGTWKTVPPLSPGGGTAISNTGADAQVAAHTLGDIPANRALKFDLSFSGLSRDGARPEFELIWGQRFKINFRDGAKIRIFRAVMGKVSGGLAQTKWEPWRVLEQGPETVLRGGRYRIVIMRLAGRLVIRVGQFSAWLLDAAVNDSLASDPFSVGDVSWGAAPLAVKCANVKVRLETGVVKWSEANGTRFTATLKRSIARPGDGGNAIGAGFSGGWKQAGGKGTKIEVVPVSGAGKATWTATLTASADGIDTPCLDRVLGRAVADWSAPQIAGTDISRAVSRASISLAMPPLLVGTEATLTLNNRILRGILGWRGVTLPRCPITIEVRWRYDNGSVSAWSKLLDGYIQNPAQDASGFGRGQTQLVCRDPMMRFQGAAGLVDHRFPPMETLFLERLQSGSSGGDNDGYDSSGKTRRGGAGQLFGAQIVQEIARIHLGPGVAARMNGNGDPLRFLPSFQPPLLSTQTDSCGYLALLDAFGGSAQSSPSLLSGNWLFPPPFWSDIYSWLMSFAADDFALCFFGWPDGDTSGEPCLMYGNYEMLIARRKLVILPDSSPGGNPHRLLSRVSIETRPEKTFNRFYVGGNLGAGTSGLEGLVPALRLAEARFAPSNPESAENSWELTDTIQNNIAAATGGIPGRGAAEAIAISRRNAVEGVRLEWPVFTFHGDATLQVGDVVQAQLSGENLDIGLFGDSISGRPFRAERIEHELEFGEGASFETTVYGRPLSNLEHGAAPPPVPRSEGDSEGDQDNFVIAV